MAAEDYFDEGSWDGFNDDDHASFRHHCPQPKACKYCGAQGLKWRSVAWNKWRLVSEKTGQLHVCSEHTRKRDVVIVDIETHSDTDESVYQKLVAEWRARSPALAYHWSHNNSFQRLPCKNPFKETPAMPKEMIKHVNLCTMELTGLHHHDYALICKTLNVGDRVELKAQPTNVVDSDAVEVRLGEHQIGWLPRSRMAEKDMLARMLRAEVELTAVIISHRHGQSVSVAVYLKCDR